MKRMHMNTHLYDLDTSSLYLGKMKSFTINCGGNKMKSIRFDRIPANREKIYALCKDRRMRVTDVLLQAEVNEANFYKHLRKEHAVFRWEAEGICKVLGCETRDLVW